MPRVKRAFDLKEFLAVRRKAGQAELRAAMRELVNDEIAGMDDAAYLEPRLFVLFALGGHSRKDLERCLRPSSIPPIAADAPPCVGRGTFRLAGTGLELVVQADPLLIRFFTHFVDSDVELELAANPPRFSTTLSTALKLIQTTVPWFHDAIVDCVKGIVLFTAPDVESFAALGAHGLIFLNVRRGEGLPYLLEEVAHQSGHVVLTAATTDRQSLFLVDPEDKLARHCSDGTGRTAYQALHGLFTEYVTIEVLRLALKDRSVAVSCEDQREMERRLIQVHARHRADLRRLEPVKEMIFSRMGREVFEFFLSANHAKGRRPACRAKPLTTEVGMLV
jgi:hypothetical protein